MGFNPFSGRGLTAIATLGGSELLGEDTMAKVPIFGPLSGAKTDEEKRLVEKQKQMAEEAKKRQAEMQRARMNALGQSMLAFNPQNQMMAEMFGPQAAFSPQQFAQMGNDPGARSEAEYKQAHAKAMEQPWAGDRRLSTQGWSNEDIQRMRENEKRKKMIEQQMTPLGPGPAPLNLPPAAAARRY
jgi:hypothetical protein